STSRRCLMSAGCCNATCAARLPAGTNITGLIGNDSITGLSAGTPEIGCPQPCARGREFNDESILCPAEGCLERARRTYAARALRGADRDYVIIFIYRNVVDHIVRWPAIIGAP